MTSGRWLLTMVGFMVVTGCAQCAPGRVGPAVSRLTIRNVGAMATLLNADTSCGFASSSVLMAPTMTGTVGGMGTLTYQVTGCVIDSGAGKEVSKSCTDVTTTAFGKVTLTAKRTVTGQLTGNAMSPIIPAGPDAVTITIESATFEDFKVESSASQNKLTMNKGSLSAVLKPRLAVNSMNGACSIASPNTTFSEVKYAMGSEVSVESPTSNFSTTVDASDISAQNGINGDFKNTLSGNITVFGKDVPAIDPNDMTGLDPDFDETKFAASWACLPGLAMPVTFTCADVKPRLAGGVARLSVRTIGTVTSMIDANTMCGFSSPAVGGTPMITGDIGKDNGVATFTIGTPCTITLPADTLLSTDCNMVTTRGTGTVTVTGTKRVSGFRTGNPLRPIVPATRDPAQFDLTLVFTDFRLVKSDSTGILLAKSGTLSGKVAPRTALDSATGACSISTPVVTFSDLSWTNGQVRLTTDGNSFDLGVGASMLNAQNGTKGATSNTISGTVTVDGTAYSLMANEPLDTAFNQATFDMSYACTPRIVIPPADVACSFRQALGVGAARLLVKNFATATSMVNGNMTCGFSAPAVLGAPTNMGGTAGMPGFITWSVNACGIGPLPANTTISTNCLGTQTNAGGTVAVTGTKTVTGIRTGMANPPIIPNARDAGTFNLSSVAFTNFELYDAVLNPDGGARLVTSRSTLGGMGSVVVKPVGGESATAADGGRPGVYSVTTPVAGIEMLSMASGTMSLVSDGNRFDVALSNVALEAFTGTSAGRSNVISGTLTVDGQPVTIMMGTPLDPAFNQTSYNASYACTPDLVSVIP